MYLPLSGFIKEYKKRGKKVSVDSVGSSSGINFVSPLRDVKPAGQNAQIGQDDNNQTTISSTNNESSCIASKSNMSTENFLSLRKSAQEGGASGAENMIDAVKDVMALKVLEKTLEAINKIMEE